MHTPTRWPHPDSATRYGSVSRLFHWGMALLFVVSGMAARYYLERHDTKAFIRDKTRKLHFPVFDGCNHMQYQIRGPKGFAGMLEKMLKENKLPELPFVI